VAHDLEPERRERRGGLRARVLVAADELALLWVWLMAVTQIGSLAENQCGTGATGSFDVTVPNDADVIVVGVHGLGAYDAQFTLTTSGVSIEGTACEVEVTQGNTSASTFQSAMWVGNVVALRGSTTATIAWAWRGTLANDARMVYGFYKGVDMTSFPTSAVRDQDGVQDGDMSGGATTPSLTASSGDRIVAWASGYTGGTPGGPTWTSPIASVTNYLTPYASGVASWAEGNPTGNMAVAETAWATVDDGGICAVVLIPAAGGGQIARPVSDVSVGGWTASSGTDRYAMVDEETASDTDYITSGANPAADECVLALGALSTPAAGTVTLRIRAKYV
jgi:hypothetical protein